MALQNQNQFAQSPNKGDVDLNRQPNTMAARVYASEAVNLIPAQAVKRVDAGGPGTLPVVTAVTSDTDDICGFVNYNIKNADFAAGEALEISAFQGNIMFMEASAAIAANADVMCVVSGSKVALATTGKRVIGKAIDKATAAGDLIRVYINLPGILSA